MPDRFWNRLSERPGSTIFATSVAIFLGLVIAIASRHEDRTIKNPALDPSHLDGGVTIADWKLIGPFHFDQNDLNPSNPHAKENGLNRDYLAFGSFHESDLNADMISKIADRHQWVTRDYHSEDSTIPFSRIFPSTDYAVIYAFSEIYSRSEGDVGIKVSSDDGLKLWVNGKLLIRTTNDVVRGADSASHFAVVRLHTGLNTFLAKVDQKHLGWSLVLSLCPPDQYAKETAENSSSTRMLIDRILPEGHEIGLLVAGICSPNAKCLEILDTEKNKICDFTLSPGSLNQIQCDLHSGLYFAHLHTGSLDKLESLYIGDIETSNKALNNLRDAQKLNSRTYLAIDALIRRYDQLALPIHYLPNDSKWQRKMIVVLENANALSKPGEPSTLLQSAGMHFGEYISPIDGQPQNYMFYVPSGSHLKVPLVVIPPPTAEHQRPFMESALIANPDVVDNLVSAAESNGMAFAVLNGRGSVHNAPIGEADILEALKDIELTLPVNLNKVYSYGTCEGGRRALVFAEHQPTLFAAAGAYGAAAVADDSDSQFSRDWNEQNSVLRLADALRVMPVGLVYGDHDDEMPLQVARDFASKLKNAGVKVEYSEVSDGHVNYYRDAPKMFKFFSEQQLKGRREPSILQTQKKLQSRNDPSGLDNSDLLEVNRHTERRRGSSGQTDLIRNGESIASTLARPFIVVVATAQSDRATPSASDAFMARWRADFSDDCRVKYDWQITKQDISEYNLVLIGKPLAKSIASQILSLLPIEVAGDTINLGGQHHFGQEYQYIAQFHNPLSPRHSVIFISAAASVLALRENDLALDGYFNFAIWDAHGKNVESGYLSSRATKGSY